MKDGQRKTTLDAVWQKGGCALNGWLAMPSAFAAEVMAAQGWDSLTVDMQHGLADYRAMVAMLAAVNTTKTAALARVPWLDEAMIMRTLDAGADGIICPMINNRNDALRLAAATRYPPLGKRSFGPIRARIVFGGDYADFANELPVLAMLETAEAVENADAILSVPGISGVYAGPSDLAYSLGCEISAPFAPPVSAALDEILAAARRNNSRAGVHTLSPEEGNAMREKGFDLVTIQSDVRLLTAAARAVVRGFRGEK